MNDQEIYRTYSAQFRLLDDELDDLVRRAENYAQAQAIMDAWKQSNLNLLKARNQCFSAGGDQVQSMVKAYTEANQAIKNGLSSLKKGETTLAKVLDLISEGVARGSDALG